MQWNHLQCCARGISAEFGEVDDFLRFLRIFPQFIIILKPETLFLGLYPCFGLQGIKRRNLENCQTKMSCTRVARLRGISTALCYFSADFKRFPSIYKYFNFRKVILVAIPILLGIRFIILTYRKLWDYQGCHIVWYFRLIWLFFCVLSIFHQFTIILTSGTWFLWQYHCLEEQRI